MSPASMAVCCVERSPASSFSKRTSWPTLGGRETCCWLASQRSSFARVALRGTEPLRKFRRPFGLMEIAAAARRNDMRAVSRPMASRNSGTGSAGTLRRLGVIAAVHFVRYCGIYTMNTLAEVGKARKQTGSLSRRPFSPLLHHLHQRPDRSRRVALEPVVHEDQRFHMAPDHLGDEAQKILSHLGLRSRIRS